MLEDELLRPLRVGLRRDLALGRQRVAEKHRDDPDARGRRPRSRSPIVRQGWSAHARARDSVERLTPQPHPSDEVSKQLTDCRDGRVYGLAVLAITAGSFRFTARLEEDAAPKTIAALRTLLPLRSHLVASPLERRVRLGAAWASSSSSESGRRTPTAIRPPGSSCSTRAGSPRWRSSSRTARPASPARWASWPGTTSPRSSRAASSSPSSGAACSGRALSRSCFEES